MIRLSRLLLLDILLLQAFISVRIVTTKFMARFGDCNVGLFEYLSMLMIICAQSGRVYGLEKKVDPASSARSDKKGPKGNNNRLLGIVTSFCIAFCTKNWILVCGGLDFDCTVTTLHRIANFRVKQLNSGIEQTRRGINLLVLLFIQLISILLYRFSVKNTVSRPVLRVKVAIF